MAGLVAAARARELGEEVRLLEKGDRPGGSMLVSSGVVWRYRELPEFRRQCPQGDESLQRLIWDRLDDALEWLERIGVTGVPHTMNPLTTGRWFDPRTLTEALVRAAGQFELRRSAPEGDGPLVVATGFLLTTRTAADASYWTTLFPALVVVAFGLAGAVAPLTTAVIASVDAQHTGTASGFNSAIARTGGLIATALLGSVLGASGDSLETAFDHAALAAAAGAALAGLVALFMLRPHEIASGKPER